MAFGAFNKADGVPRGSEPQSFIGEGSEFRGSLTIKGNVQIDGSFEGEVAATGNVTIGEHAHFKATIMAGSVTVSGQVEGNITARERVDLKPTAKVIGDIKSPIMSIGEGVILEGRCIIDRSAAGNAGQ